MKHSDKILEQLPTNAASSKNIPTTAGPMDSNKSIAEKTAGNMPDKAQVVNAINQMFAEFELVYHNQYAKAFPSEEKLSYAKKLWFSHLAEFSAAQILNAAKRATRESEFLPTVKGILKYCQADLSTLGLPDAHSAYMEACRAPSPKAGATWSHPAVFYAGRDSDWYFLANTIEQQAFPIFRTHYANYCQRVLDGEILNAPHLPELPAPKKSAHKPVDVEAVIAEMKTTVR
jgi:hypothetical protein